MKPALSSDYYALKEFFRFVSDRWSSGIPLPPESKPVVLLEQLEKTNQRQAAASLRVGVNDLMEMSSRMKPGELAALDTELAGAGLLTLTHVHAKYSKRLQALLKRGAIRTEVEYYLLQGVVTDKASGIDEATREKAQQLCHAYEAKVSARTHAA